MMLFRKAAINKEGKENRWEKMESLEVEVGGWGRKWILHLAAFN